MRLRVKSGLKMKTEVLTKLDQLSATLDFIDSSEAALYELFFDETCKVINVLEKDQIVGTITLRTPTEYPDKAFFGSYKVSSQDKRDEIRNALFDVVYQELTNKKELFGPICFNTWLSNRYKISGSEFHYHWEPKPAPQEIEDLCALGFINDAQYITNFYSSELQLLENTQPAYEHCLAEGFKFEDITIDGLQEQQKLYQLNCICFSQNYLYTPITFEQYQRTHLRALQDFDFTYCSYITKDGKAQGYIFSFEDQGEIIIKTILIDPQVRNAGLASAMVHESVKRAQANCIHKGAGALVRVGNISEKFFQALASPASQNHYQLYKKVLNG
jgi:hypothetical protein